MGTVKSDNVTVPQRLSGRLKILSWRRQSHTANHERESSSSAEIQGTVYPVLLLTIRVATNCCVLYPNRLVAVVPHVGRQMSRF